MPTENLDNYPSGTLKNPRRVHVLKVGRPDKPLVPRLLAHHDAASYLGRSVGWLRNQRGKDIQRLRAGLEPVGPGWVKIGPTPMYPIEDYQGVSGLHRWIDENSEPYGAGEQPGQAAGHP